LPRTRNGALKRAFANLNFSLVVAGWLVHPSCCTPLSAVFGAGVGGERRPQGVLPPWNVMS